MSPNNQSETNFSFQLTASYVWYNMEKLEADLLLRLKFVKLSILPTLFIHIVYGRLGELGSRYLELNTKLPSTLVTTEPGLASSAT